MIQFSINSFSNGLTGRSYNSIKDAIQDGSYSVWCNYGEFDQVVVYGVYPINLNDIEFV